jgi:F-type H+-transporting ATPase subunit O
MSRVLSRAFATATKSVRPPVQLFGLDGTYATALYTSAAKTTSVESANASLVALQQTIVKDAKLGAILQNPALTSKDRAFVAETLVKSQDKVDGSVANLVKVLGENNRLDLLSSIFAQFKTLNDAHNGIVEAVVTSSKELDSKTLKKIEASVTKSKFVGAGKTLRLTNKVDPEILGGLIVEVGDRTVDLSIASKVAKLNNALKEAI